MEIASIQDDSINMLRRTELLCKLVKASGDEIGERLRPLLRNEQWHGHLRNVLAELVIAREVDLPKDDSLRTLRVTVFRAHHRINASPDNTTPADDDAVSQFRSTRSRAAMIDTSSRACASSTEASATTLESVLGVGQ